MDPTELGVAKPPDTLQAKCRSRGDYNSFGQGIPSFESPHCALPFEEMSGKKCATFSFYIENLSISSMQPYAMCMWFRNDDFLMQSWLESWVAFLHTKLNPNNLWWGGLGALIQCTSTSANSPLVVMCYNAEFSKLGCGFQCNRRIKIKRKGLYMHNCTFVPAEQQPDVSHAIWSCQMNMDWTPYTPNRLGWTRFKLNNTCQDGHGRRGR